MAIIFQNLDDIFLFKAYYSIIILLFYLKLVVSLVALWSSSIAIRSILICFKIIFDLHVYDTQAIYNY